MFSHCRPKTFLIKDEYNGVDGKNISDSPVKTSDIDRIFNKLQLAIKNKNAKELTKIIAKHQLIIYPNLIQEYTEHQSISAKFVYANISRTYQIYHTTTLLEALFARPQGAGLDNLIDLLKNANDHHIETVFTQLFTGSELASSLKPRVIDVDDLRENALQNIKNLKKHVKKLQGIAFNNEKFISQVTHLQRTEIKNPEMIKIESLNNIIRCLEQKLQDIPSTKAYDLVRWKIDFMQILNSHNLELSPFRGNATKIKLFENYNKLMSNLPFNLGKKLEVHTTSENLINKVAHSFR